MPQLATLPITIIAILVALTVHEWAHAFAAHKLGDDTARWEGRMTLNPLAHLDPLGALLFVIVGFGWAKPVPVDVRNFRQPVRDAALVALAGPASNLILAAACVVPMLWLGPDGRFPVEGAGATEALSGIAAAFLFYSLRFNLALMAFNLLPIAPLDGSNILRLFVPWRMRGQYEDAMRYGPWILLALILAESFLGVSILGAWVRGISNAVLALLTLPFGG